MRRPPLVAVLFDGAGLARLGLEQAGCVCLGVEIEPIPHYLGRFVGSGNCVLGDATTFDLTGFDAVWASPPCQLRSKARNSASAPASPHTKSDLTQWALDLCRLKPTVWVENVFSDRGRNDWGNHYNAAQFLAHPVQNRNRIVGGSHPLPFTFRDYVKTFPSISPCVTATEYKGCATDSRRASRFFGRRLTLQECASLQGFEIPPEWAQVPKGYAAGKWLQQQYKAIGNGVPVYMARARSVTH